MSDLATLRQDLHRWLATGLALHERLAALESAAAQAPSLAAVAARPAVDAAPKAARPRRAATPPRSPDPADPAPSPTEIAQAIAAAELPTGFRPTVMLTPDRARVLLACWPMRGVPNIAIARMMGALPGEPIQENPRLASLYSWAQKLGLPPSRGRAPNEQPGPPPTRPAPLWSDERRERFRAMWAESRDNDAIMAELNKMAGPALTLHRQLFDKAGQMGLGARPGIPRGAKPGTQYRPRVPKATEPSAPLPLAAALRVAPSGASSETGDLPVPLRRIGPNQQTHAQPAAPMPAGNDPGVADAALERRHGKARALLLRGTPEATVAHQAGLPLREVIRIKGELREQQLHAAQEAAE